MAEMRALFDGSSLRKRSRQMRSKSDSFWVRASAQSDLFEHGEQRGVGGDRGKRAGKRRATRVQQRRRLGQHVLAAVHQNQLLQAGEALDDGAGREERRKWGTAWRRRSRSRCRGSASGKRRGRGETRCLRECEKKQRSYAQKGDEIELFGHAILRVHDGCKLVVNQRLHHFRGILAGQHTIAPVHKIFVRLARSHHRQITIFSRYTKRQTPSIAARDFGANNVYMPYGHSSQHIPEAQSPVSSEGEKESD